jgi:hypothetical protein
MSQSLIVLVAVNLVLTAAIVLWLGWSRIARRLSDLQAALMNPRLSLERNVHQIQAGDGKQRVETMLGVPTVTPEGEWVYYLDRNSGYLISFTGDRVERVRSWVS